MSAIRSLRIKLGNTDVGSLFAIDDGRTYFRFDTAYAMNPDSPVLSISYLGENALETQTALLDPSLRNNIGAGHGRLPSFFRNLLPEGVLRKHIVSESGVGPDDELGLLAFCGTDLPGNVVALSENLDEPALARLITQGNDSYEMSSYQLPTPDATSLSGVQPKISLVQEPGGRYVMRSKNDAGLHYIGKLPASDYQGLPEVEHLSLQLAAKAGVNVCTAELLPLSSIASQLPFALRDDARNFLLVHRFDRDVDTESKRRHMEDFAQILNIAPEDKYKGDYATLGLVLQDSSSKGEEDILELIRRIKVNEMLGNFDAHLKNFSLLYCTPTSACLSPAYDIVAYAAYLRGQGHGMMFYSEAGKSKTLSPAVLRRLSNIWAIPEKRLALVVGETVELAVRNWPMMIRDSAIAESQKDQLLMHFESNETVAGLQKRMAKAK